MTLMASVSIQTLFFRMIVEEKKKTDCLQPSKFASHQKFVSMHTQHAQQSWQISYNFIQKSCFFCVIHSHVNTRVVLEMNRQWNAEYFWTSFDLKNVWFYKFSKTNSSRKIMASFGISNILFKKINPKNDSWKLK